ncbi:hypothetical protein BC834DRAFT_980932 [Gloeopeniophorella convolvens]|nr:hypothetical protein BC834DRAFT_980932 [Gloeopeniophorella convolvens]
MAHPPTDVTQFFDLEAEVDHGEEEDEEDEYDEFGDFLDDEAGESVGRGSSPARDPDSIAHEARALNAAADELVAHYRRHAGMSGPGVEVLQHQLLPMEGDPEIHAFHVKRGFEDDLVQQLMHRAQERLTCQLDPGYSAAFTCSGIPGYIYVEGPRASAHEAVQHLVSVLNHNGFLVPSDERAPLLSPPIGGRLEPKAGLWVEARRGLYRDDIGYALRANDTPANDFLVAFVPRIREAEKRGRRNPRPPPKARSQLELASLHGTGSVTSSGGNKYRFRGQNFEDSLVIKRLPAAEVEVAARPPLDIEAFVRAECVRTHTDFSSALAEWVRHGLDRDDKVGVVTGPFQSARGRLRGLQDSVASVGLEWPPEIAGQQVNVPLAQVYLRYEPGDFVKQRWDHLYGPVASVNDAHGTLMYVEQRSTRPINLTPVEVEVLQDYVCARALPTHMFTPSPGLWVEWGNPRNPALPKSRGRVQRVLPSGLVVVANEVEEIKDIQEEPGQSDAPPGQRRLIRKLAEVELDTRVLTVSEHQGTRKRPADPRSQDVGKEALVTRGQWKGYFGIVKETTSDGAIIELDARNTFHVGTNSRVTVRSDEWKPMAQRRRGNTSPSRTRTPPPEEGPSTLTRAITPELEGAPRHWLFAEEVQAVLESKRVPFYLRGLPHNSPLKAQESDSVWMVPPSQRKMEPVANEVVVSITRNRGAEEVSINPRYLVPWDLAPKSDVLVVSDAFIGKTGKLLRMDHGFGFVELHAQVRGSAPSEVPLEAEKLVPILDAWPPRRVIYPNAVHGQVPEPS